MLTRLHVCRRWFLAASLALMAAPTLAEPLPKVKFTLDWRFEGPSAPFLLAKAKGYFQAEGVDVEIDSGSGSAGAVTRVATGAYEMGFADFNALVEYDAKTPGSKIQAVYMCRIPSDHIPIRSWPLFLARELMRDLIETLKAEQST